MKQCVLVVLTAVACAVASAVGAQAPPAFNTALDAYLSQENSVTLEDGRRIHLVCMGVGSPTVVLTAGAGNWSIAWARVQPEVAKLTRVCAWDRPGFGFSSASPVPQTVTNTTNDLEAALSRGGIEGPYVMVGHSLGGYESLLFADRHRSTVAGMVLVDPGIPDHLARIGRSAPEIAREMREIAPRQVAMLRQCAQIVRERTFTFNSADAARCRAILVFPNFSKVLSDALIQWWQDPALFETYASQVQSAEETHRLAVNPARNYGSMSLIVLSSTIPDAPPPGSPERRAILLAEAPKAQAELSRGHEELAALSTVGVHRSVPDVGHFIQMMKPEVVVAAIAETVKTARVH